MQTWSDYKKYVKHVDPEMGKEIADIEAQAEIISAMIKQRNELGLSQRDLAELCGMPQSSIARIESLKMAPSLTTLLKVLRPLGLKITISK